MKIFTYLSENLVFFLDSDSKENALHELVFKSSQVMHLQEVGSFYDAIKEREKIVSTGIGMGVAIPHAKLSSIDDFFISIGILNKGIDWTALDNAPVRIILLIGGPDDKQTEYLKILSSLTVALREEDLRKHLLLATSPKEVIQLFENY